MGYIAYQVLESERLVFANLAQTLGYDLKGLG